MFCALSQFLDRNAHVAESGIAPSDSVDGDGPTSSTTSSPGASVNKNSFVPRKTSGKDSLNDGEQSTLKLWFSRSRSRSKLLDLNALRTRIVRSKSFPSSRQSNCLSEQMETNSDGENDNDSASDEEAASPIHHSCSSEDLSALTSECRNTDPSVTIQPQPQDISQGGGNNIRRHNRRHLPVPTGPHTVGCVDLMCDLSDRGTFFRLYYPTNPTDIQRAYKQWPLWLPRKQYAHGYMYFLKRNRTIFGRLANWLGGDVYAPVLWQAPLLKSDETFPVLIVSHGIGGNRTTLSTYSYELASRGFVVAAIEHRDGTASMTLCLTEQLESSIVDSDEAANRSNNNDRNIVNNNTNDLQQPESQQHHSTQQPGQFEREIEQVVSMQQHQQQQQELPKSHELEQEREILVNHSNSDQLSSGNITNGTKCAIDSEIFTKDLDIDQLETKSTGGIGVSHADGSLSNPAPAVVDEEMKTLGAMNGSTGLESSIEATSQSQLPGAAQAYNKVETRSGDLGRGAWVKQRRENRQRSLRHNHTCSEEWRPFQHIEIWDDFNYRNGQMYQRADEISDLLDELISMNEGSHINNALGLAFTTNQFKNRLDFSRVAVIGHSFGGAAALASLVTDDRFKVGLCLDAWMHPLDSYVTENTRQPALFLNMEQFQWEKNVNRMIQFQEARPEADRPMMTLIGGCHQSMTDFQFIVPQVVGRLIDVCHSLPPAQCMSTILEASLAFLRKHIDLPMEPHDKDVLDCKHPHLMRGTNVDLTIPDDGPTPP